MNPDESQSARDISAEDYAERLLFSLASLSDICGLFTSEDGFEDVAGAALRGILGTVGTSRGALLVPDVDGTELRCLVSRGVRRGIPPIEISKGLRAQIVGAKAPLTLDGPDSRVESLAGCREVIDLLKARVWVPLAMGRDALGVLSLGPKLLDDVYGNEDLQLLWTIGRHLSVALFNQRLVEEIRSVNFNLSRKVVELETVYDAGLALSSSLVVEDVIEEVLSLAVSVVDARSGILLYRSQRTRRFSVAHRVGIDEQACDAFLEPSMRRRMAKALSTGETLHLGSSELPSESKMTCAVGVPVGESGFLIVADKESRRGIQDFGETDIHLLELMGQQAGAALANARLYHDITEVKNYNQNILTSIGSGVVSTDLNGRIVQLNPAAVRVLGDDPSLRGKSCAALLRRLGCRELAAAVQATLADGKQRNVDGDIIEELGVTIDARVTALRDEQEAIQGLVIALEDLTEQMRVRTMFSQYASDQVVDLVLSKPTAPTLGGEVLEVTSLFVDTRGSTALTSRIGAEAMVDLLNDCFGRLNDIIFDHNGTLNKYTGDGILVVFGAPVSFPDDTERAVRTAISIREEMVRFNRGRDEPLRLAYGIARGEVLAGNIGSRRRMEYTVIGPDVNLAARLCDGARAGQIWTAPNVYEELRDRFEFDFLGREGFKGVEPIDIYEVVGPKGLRPGRSRERSQAMADEPKKTQKQVDLTIPMVPEMELAAGRTAEALAEFMDLEKEKIEEIKMALIEACINAFEHSRSKDERVFINFDIGDDDLTIQISDRGQGFDPERAREEVVNRRNRKETRRGWGLKIMEELMDGVSIQSDPNGTTITMVKRR